MTVPLDDRRTCHQCRHYRPGKCTNAIRAELSLRSKVAEVGEQFASLLQRCWGYLG